MSQTRASKDLAFWIAGVNSLIHPAFIADEQYAWAENVINRGGIIQTRPGMRFLSSIQGKRLQGFATFKPLNSPQVLVAIVDGYIYACSAPFTTPTKVSKTQFFDPNSEQVNFCPTLKSTKSNPDGSLKLITPYRLLVMQDGVRSAVTWDGTTLSNKNNIPVGLWMAWASSRLWVATGSTIKVGDIGDPTSFTETKYLAERSNFELPSECTGLIQTTDEQGLLAFTRTTTTAFKSYIRDRPTWQQTPNFQTLLLDNIGCVGGKAIINHYGLTYWYSEHGLISLDAALASKQTSRVATIDGGMMRSKRKISPDRSGIVMARYENLMLVSVPSGDKHNSQTWVLDFTPLGQAGGNPAWASVWTGFRPVEWATLNVVGRQRCFCASFDKTKKEGTNIHLWEAFDPKKTDNIGGRIGCQFETKMVVEQTTKQFSYAELEIIELVGEVELKAWMGGLKGPWINVLEVTLKAAQGPLGKGIVLPKTHPLAAYAPQKRTIRTEDYSPQDEKLPVESKDIAGVDKAHGLLIQWKGRMGIAAIRLATQDFFQKDRGVCETSEDNGIIVLDDGEQADAPVELTTFIPPTPIVPIIEGSLPPFDFAIIRYKWTDANGTDLDTRTALVNVNGAVNGIDVGWSRAGSVGDFLVWGGDNTGTNAAEAVLVDFAKLKQAYPLLSQFELRMRAFWFNAAVNGSFVLEFATYRGGAMQASGTDFVNVGGSQVTLLTIDRHSATSSVGEDVDGDDMARLLFYAGNNTADLIPA